MAEYKFYSCSACGQSLPHGKVGVCPKCKRVLVGERTQAKPGELVVGAIFLAIIGGVLWFYWSDIKRMFTGAPGGRVTEEQAKRDQAARMAERARVEQERVRADAEQQAKDLVAFFHDGGTWSMELPGTEAPAEAPTTPGSPAGSTGARLRVLVLGPPGLLQSKGSVPLGWAVASGPGRADAKKRLEELPLAPQDRRELFLRRVADALAAGDVDAGLVALKLPSPSGAASRTGPAPGRPGDSGIL